MPAAAAPAPAPPGAQDHAECVRSTAPPAAVMIVLDHLGQAHGDCCGSTERRGAGVRVGVHQAGRGQRRMPGGCLPGSTSRRVASILVAPAGKPWPMATMRSPWTRHGSSCAKPGPAPPRMTRSASRHRSSSLGPGGSLGRPVSQRRDLCCQQSHNGVKYVEQGHIRSDSWGMELEGWGRYGTWLWRTLGGAAHRMADYRPGRRRLAALCSIDLVLRWCSCHGGSCCLSGTVVVVLQGSLQ